MMKRVLMSIVGIIAFVALMAVVVVTYYGRPRGINFAEILPDRFTYCGEQIDRGSKAYVALAKWMAENQSQWHQSPASYVPRAVLRSPGMSVNIMAEAVVVNFKSEDEGWQQMVRSKSRKALITFVCK